MPAAPMSITDWETVPVTRHAGDAGYALWRTREFGGIRVRMVEYSPGYRADHWCQKGHVLLCLEGSLEVTVRDGPVYLLGPGQSYHVGDGDPPHRSHSPAGARLFIVD